VLDRVSLWWRAVLVYGGHVSVHRKSVLLGVVLATGGLMVVAAVVAGLIVNAKLDLVVERVGMLSAQFDAFEGRVPAIAPSAPSALAIPFAELAVAGVATGPSGAPVTIVEFSDFECPFCASLQPTLEEVRRQYGDRVRFVFRHYPLTGLHPDAWKAAEAAACADEQGRFWDLHGELFANQGSLGVPELKEIADVLGLDRAAFDDCLDSGRLSVVVEADVRAGNDAGVKGTPAMFVNGELVVGAVPFVELAAVIDRELDS